MRASQLVFAYGSNMEPDQMRERCPESDLSWFRARARGWKLVFPRKSGKRKGGVGSLGPGTKDSSVWGIVFSVTPRDLKRLDGFEGVNSGSYRQEPIDVLDEHGVLHHVLTYFANSENAASRNYLPHQDYIQLYIKGATYFELPEEYIENLKAIRTRKADANRRSKKGPSSK